MQSIKQSVKDTISQELPPYLKTLVASYVLPEQTHAQILEQIKKDSYQGKVPQKVPKFIIVLGQTGSGKTNLTNMLIASDPNIVLIDSDKYKAYRPDNEEILKNHLTVYSELTRPDGMRHRDEMVIDTMKLKYNILFECAPCTKEGFYVDPLLIKKAGYQIEMHVLAVSNYNSLLSIHERYEHQIESKYECAKLTGIQRHDDAFNSLISCVEQAQKDKDIQIFVYQRGNKPTYQPQLSFSTEDLSIKPKDAVEHIKSIHNRDTIEALTSFHGRYNTIVKKMDERKAPESQRNQLNIIKQRFYEKMAKVFSDLYSRTDLIYYSNMCNF